MCRQYDSVLASASTLPSALTQVLLPLCLCPCLRFYHSVWLSYQRPWASPAQTNQRSVLWLAHKAIRQGRGGGRALGGMPQTPVQRFSHDSSDDVADTAAGHGNWELGPGTWEWEWAWARDWGRGKCQWANRKYKSGALKATPKRKLSEKRGTRNEKRQNETQRYPKAIEKKCG